MSITVTRICSVLPAGAGPWTTKVQVPPGLYRVGFACKSTLGAADTTLAIAPYVDASQTQAAGGFAIGSDGVTLALTVAFASGAAGKSGRAAPCLSGTTVTMGDPVVFIPNGLKVTVAKGSSASGDAFELDLLLSQVRDAIAPSGVSAAVLA